MSDLPEIAFDDLEGLRSVITEEWSDWGPEYEMTQEKVNQFAEDRKSTRLNSSHT